LTFNHVDLDLPQLERETIDGVRYYKVPDNDELIKLVSITSVISHINREKFIGWRKKVGEEQANKITKRATSRGTDTHSLIESYLLNETLPSVQPISEYLFKIAKATLNRINNIHCLESSLHSKILGVAGTVDTIAEFDKELSVIDYKTSKEPKPIEWIEGYFVQAMFYAMAFYEMTGIMVKKLVIIMTCENGECVVYEERNLKKYMKLVVKYIKEFVNDKLVEIAK
jgi:genome maintenance exonuclease 1